jgi:hypothetical protein
LIVTEYTEERAQTRSAAVSNRVSRYADSSQNRPLPDILC